MMMMIRKYNVRYITNVSLSTATLSTTTTTTTLLHRTFVDNKIGDNNNNNNENDIYYDYDYNTTLKRRGRRILTTTATTQQQRSFSSYTNQQQQRKQEEEQDQEEQSFRQRSTSTNTSSMSTLRNSIKPFLLKCHPDVTLEENNKKINLLAIQNLNSYLDKVELYYNDPMKMMKNISSLLQQNENNYEEIMMKYNLIMEIDFAIVPDHENDNKNRTSSSSKNSMIPTKSKKHTRNQYVPWSRRKIQLVLPTYKSIPLKPGENQTMQQNIQRYHIHQHVAKEIMKLLKVASLPVPKHLLESHNRSSSQLGYEDDDDDQNHPNDNGNVFDSIYNDFYAGDGNGNAQDPTNNTRRKTSFGHSRSFDSNNDEQQQQYTQQQQTQQEQQQQQKRFETPYEKNRRTFFKRMDMKKFHELYEQAVVKMEAEFATEGLIAKNYNRKRTFLSNIISRIKTIDEIKNKKNKKQQRIQQYQKEDDYMDHETKQRNIIFGNDSDPYTIITTLDKLIAIRQLCILFEKECFDRYEMELYSRLWEQNGKIKIVLTPPRSPNGTSLSTSKINKLKRKQQQSQQQQQKTIVQQSQTQAQQQTSPKEKESSSSVSSDSEIPNGLTTITTTNLNSDGSDDDNDTGGDDNDMGSENSVNAGFVFIFHPNDTVTIQIPIDFHTEEFFMEFENNIWDVYDVVGYKNHNILEEILDPE